jgi:hypothetical protein
LQIISDLAVSGSGCTTLAASFIAAKHAIVDKHAIAAEVPLAHPKHGTVLTLAVGASDTHVEAVLQQLHNPGWPPLAFLLAKMFPCKPATPTFNQELLAVF